jgi:FHA domain
MEGYDEDDMTPSWVLRRSIHERNKGAELRNERVRIPAEGLTLGRQMQVPGLERATHELIQRPGVSREHARLMPLEDGRIRIVDTSSNGTRIHEEHWNQGA